MASIVPSILAGDFARLGESLNVVQSLGAAAIHIDVADGHFRPQISVGQPVVTSIRKATHLKLDVHLMIERPERYIVDFVNAGADCLAFHPEATQNPALAMNLAKERGVHVGLALSPAMPVDACYELLNDLDYVLVQTGNDGPGVETFTPSSLKKVAAIANARESCGLNFAVEVEGGIGAREAEELICAGADILVVGSAIFDKKDRGEAMRAVIRALNEEPSTFARDMRFRVH